MKTICDAYMSHDMNTKNDTRFENLKMQTYDTMHDTYDKMQINTEYGRLYEQCNTTKYVLKMYENLKHVIQHQSFKHFELKSLSLSQLTTSKP